MYFNVFLVYGVSICQSTFFIIFHQPSFLSIFCQGSAAAAASRTLRRRGGGTLPGGALWPSTLQWGRLGGAGTKLGNELPHSFQKASGQLDDVKFLQKMCDFEVCSFHLFSFLFMSCPLTESILFEDKPQEVIRAYAAGCIRQAVDEPEVLGWETSS